MERTNGFGYSFNPYLKPFTDARMPSAPVNPGIKSEVLPNDSSKLVSAPYADSTYLPSSQCLDAIQRVGTNILMQMPTRQRTQQGDSLEDRVRARVIERHNQNYFRKS